MIPIVIGGCSNRLCKQALRDPKVTLQDLLLEGWHAEISNLQATDIEKGSTCQQGETLQAVKSMKSAVQWHRKPGSTMKCRGCGGIFPQR